MPSFIAEFCRNPLRTAAIAPSSRYLAAAMLDGVDLASVRTIVEFGPGTGVFTRATLAGLEAVGNTEARYVALELNERLAGEIANAHPAIETHHANALDVEDLLGDVGRGGVDLVISGLGWPSIPTEPRRAILERTRRILRPRGRFHTFGYHIGLCMPGAWDFRRKVRDLFTDVTISPVEWRNLPPAFVYRCVA
jgi:phospholipid N-methyltransferase